MRVERLGASWPPILWVAVLCVGIGLVVSVFFITADKDKVASPKLPPISNETSSRTQPASTSPVAEAQSDEIQSANKLVPDDILTVCPDPSTEPSAACWDYLDKFLLDKRQGYKWLDWIHMNDALTFRRIFEDPVLDRQKVIETLNNPECALMNETDFRWDLFERCYAPSFTNFLHFNLKCSSPHTYAWRIDSWFFPQHEKEDGVFYSTFDSHMEAIRNAPDDSKHVRTQRLWEEILEDRWIVRQCEKFDAADILLDFERDAELRDELKEVGLRLGVRWENFEGIYWNIPVKNSLKAIAAHFGDTWSVMTHHGSEMWRAYRDERYPWIKATYALTSVEASRLKKLESGVQTVIGLEDSKFEFDWHFLVNYICTDQSKPDPENCQTTIHALRNSLAPTEFRRHKTLDQIERIALDLGVYSDTEADNTIH